MMAVRRPLLEGSCAYSYDRQEGAKQVFGTEPPKHPGVANVLRLQEFLLGGNLQVFGDIAPLLARYRLTPLETRVLFEAKGWRTVVGFQTRNFPYGHEYAQKTAPTFVDGLVTNSVIGRKKAGDFKDNVSLRTYAALVHDDYFGEPTVLATLHTKMHFAGPREAIFHAIVRKNFGCTHFIAGRDHARAGDYDAPYATQESFDAFPDLGLIPLFFTAFVYLSATVGAAPVPPMTKRVCTAMRSECSLVARCCAGSCPNARLLKVSFDPRLPTLFSTRTIPSWR